MKDPLDVGTVIKGRNYTVPTFTNLYGQKVSGNNATIKVYDPSNSVENHGIMPVTLAKVLHQHLEEKSDLSLSEEMAKTYLESIIAILK